MMRPSQARDGRNAAAAIGFGAGALVGAAVASSANRGYYYAPSYGYAPGYYAEPAYAYEPETIYMEPAPTYYYSRPYYRSNSNCGGSPASAGYAPCN